VTMSVIEFAGMRKASPVTHEAALLEGLSTTTKVPLFSAATFSAGGR